MKQAIKLVLEVVGLVGEKTMKRPISIGPHGYSFFSNWTTPKSTSSFFGKTYQSKHVI